MNNNNNTSPVKPVEMINLWADGVQDEIIAGHRYIRTGTKVLCGSSEPSIFIGSTGNTLDVVHWQGSEAATQELVTRRIDMFNKALSRSSVNSSAMSFAESNATKALKWSGDYPVPNLGDIVHGWIPSGSQDLRVVGFQNEHGFLGLWCEPVNITDHYKKNAEHNSSKMSHIDCFLFGSEVKPVKGA